MHYGHSLLFRLPGERLEPGELGERFGLKNHGLMERIVQGRRYEGGGYRMECVLVGRGWSRCPTKSGMGCWMPLKVG